MLGQGGGGKFVFTESGGEGRANLIFILRGSTHKGNPRGLLKTTLRCVLGAKKVREKKHSSFR